MTCDPEDVAEALVPVRHLPRVLYGDGSLSETWCGLRAADLGSSDARFCQRCLQEAYPEGITMAEHPKSVTKAEEALAEDVARTLVGGWFHLYYGGRGGPKVDTDSKRFLCGAPCELAHLTVMAQDFMWPLCPTCHEIDDA